MAESRVYGTPTSPYHPGMEHFTGHKVSPESLEEFRFIDKEGFGEEISTEEAVAMTHRLLAPYRLLSQPLRGEPSGILLRQSLRLKALTQKSLINGDQRPSAAKSRSELPARGVLVRLRYRQKTARHKRRLAVTIRRQLRRK
jgi:hypothetical protein